MEFKWTQIFTVVTPFLVLIVLVVGGGGHGTVIPAILCYPVLYLFERLSGDGGPIIWITLLMQFPIYGLIIDIGRKTSRPNLAGTIVAVSHIAMVLFAVINQ